MEDAPLSVALGKWRQVGRDRVGGSASWAQSSSAQQHQTLTDVLTPSLAISVLPADSFTILAGDRGRGGTVEVAIICFTASHPENGDIYHR